MTRRPPRIAERLFHWYCGKARIDDFIGDLEEIFHRNVERGGYRRAAWIYTVQVFSMMFSYAVRKRKENASLHSYSSTNNLDMILNYFKVGFRNLLRFRYFTIINVAGLAVGMSISLLFITLFITVTDYDEFHEKKDRIYRVRTNLPKEGEFASAPAILGEKILSEFSGVESLVHIEGGLFTDEPLPKQEIYLQGYFTNPEFLSTFNFPLVAGDVKSALTDPSSVVLTESSAKRVFGDRDPMGQQVQVNSRPYQVTGVLKDFPPNTHFSFNAIGAYSGVARNDAPVQEAWSSVRNHYLYVLLKSGSTAEDLQVYLDRTAEKVRREHADFQAEFKVQPLGDITPGPELENDLGPSWSYLSFTIAGGLALLILLPACFNYTNISIARALRRSREIGLRKTLGGVSRQIFAQFITETVLVSLLALVGACIIFVLVRGEFQSILVHASALDLSLTPMRFLWFLGFALFTGAVAGFLPALHFSRLNPIEAIKSNVSTRFFSSIKMRKVLIVFQFALCLTFILGLVIFNKQYRYALNFDLGFNRENILDVDLNGVNPDVVRNEFSKLPFVEKVSFSSSVMGHGVPSTWASLDGSADSVEVFQMFVDNNFIPNMGLTLLAGSNSVSSEHGETSVVINETMMKRLAFAGPSEALGQSLRVDSLTLTITGVIKDFHFWQLHAPPGNFFFRSMPDKYRLANLKIASDDMIGALAALEETWKHFTGGATFSSRFLSDETTGSFYMYQTLLKIFGFLGLLAVSVSCLGLLGMVVYTAETRTKEVGIRKVMGASRWSISVLLTKSFLSLMLISSLFALPVSLVFDRLLSSLDHYRVAITFLDICAGLAIMFLLGIGTMAFQTWKTASTNPADTLKAE